MEFIFCLVAGLFGFSLGAHSVEESQREFRAEQRAQREALCDVSYRVCTLNPDSLGCGKEWAQCLQTAKRVGF